MGFFPDDHPLRVARWPSFTRRLVSTDGEVGSAAVTGNLQGVKVPREGILEWHGTAAGFEVSDDQTHWISVVVGGPPVPCPHDGMLYFRAAVGGIAGTLTIVHWGLAAAYVRVGGGK